MQRGDFSYCHLPIVGSRLTTVKTSSIQGKTMVSIASHIQLLQSMCMLGTLSTVRRAHPFRESRTGIAARFHQGIKPAIHQ